MPTMRIALVLMTALAGSAAGQFSVYDWSFENPCGSGSLSDELMHVVGCDSSGDSGSPLHGIGTYYRATAPYDGTLYARADFFNHDIFWGVDWPSWEVAGAAFIVDMNYESWKGNLVFDVAGGETFGLGAASGDAVFGPGEVDLTAFHYFPDGETRRVVSDATDDAFGSAVAAAGDVDGDGVPDVLVGAPLSDVGGTDAGRALLFSGADGSVLFDVSGAAPGDRFGSSVDGVGDVDGDGVPDVVVGAPFSALGGLEAGAAVVISGATGSAIHVLLGDAPGDHFGFDVAGVGDADGDGVPDVLVGAPWEDTAGTKAGLVRLVSGADGSVLLDLHGAAARDQYGTHVDGAGDVDGDGLPDLLVGAPLADAGGMDRGTVTLHSGLSGAVLQQWTGLADEQHFGTSVAGVGDVDRDGAGDVLVGTPDGPPPEVRLLSGAGGGVLQSHASTDLLDMGAHGGPPSITGLTALGLSVGAAGDVDADGIPDLQFKGLVHEWPLGTFSEYTALVFVTSGRDGRLLDVLQGIEQDQGHGDALDALGDLDGDGRGDLLLGDPGETDFPVGAYETITTRVVWADLGGGLAGAGMPHLTGAGLAAAGTPVILDLADAPPSSPIHFVVGLAALDLPLFGGTLVPAFQAPAGTILLLASDAAGTLHLSAPWPGGLGRGVSLWMQAWMPDGVSPSGWSASNAVRVTVP